MPNPLVPTQPIFRVSWRFENGTSDAATSWESKADELTCFVPLVWSLFALCFGALPFVIFSRAGDLLILAVFLLIYVNVISIVMLLWIRRRRIEVTSRQFATLAFDLLICPPFAMNIIKRLALMTPVAEDFVVAARRLQYRADWCATRVELIARLDEEIGGEDEDSLRLVKLKVHRSALVAEDDNVAT